MLDSIYVAMTGLLAFTKGLRNIGNNTGNLNTPGFKSAQLQFTDLFARQGMQAGTGGGTFAAGQGHGVNTLGLAPNLAQGELRQTGNTLDLAIDGAGLFTLRDSDGGLRYTRAGQFEFNADGQLASRGDGALVLGVDASGRLEPVSLDGLRIHPGRATRTIVLRGNLPSTGTTETLGNLMVFDRTGTARTLTLALTSEAAASPGRWSAVLKEGNTELGQTTLRFVDGRPDPATAALAFQLNGESLSIVLGSDVTSFAGGTQSTLAMASQDGAAAGELAHVEFDGRGVLQLSYSNGETVQGTRLALARFDAPVDATIIGGTAFRVQNQQGWHFGAAGDAGFGTLRAGRLEMSNVDMTAEFSQLVILQRGYQGASSVITSASEMLQQLFGIVGTKS